MVKIDAGVFDTGPLLHLHEIDAFLVLALIKRKCTTPEVEQELFKYRVLPPKGLHILSLSLKHKNTAKFLCEQYTLNLGEATAIALAQQENIRLFFTDDLEAREAGIRFHLEVHGTLGILLRAYRENIISKEQALSFVKELGTSSSLFLTSDLIHYIIKEIEQFRKN